MELVQGLIAITLPVLGIKTTTGTFVCWFGGKNIPVNKFQGKKTSQKHDMFAP